jgi:hypothetical protein
MSAMRRRQIEMHPLMNWRKDGVGLAGLIGAMRRLPRMRLFMDRNGFWGFHWGRPRS